MEIEKKELLSKAIEELRPTTDFLVWCKENVIDPNDAVSVLAFNAYMKGCNEYNSRAWEAERKYTKLAIKLADNMIKD